MSNLKFIFKKGPISFTRAQRVLSYHLIYRYHVNIKPNHDLFKLEFIIIVLIVYVYYAYKGQHFIIRILARKPETLKEWSSGLWTGNLANKLYRFTCLFPYFIDILEIIAPIVLFFRGYLKNKISSKGKYFWVKRTERIFATFAIRSKRKRTVFIGRNTVCFIPLLRHLNTNI